MIGEGVVSGSGYDGMRMSSTSEREETAMAKPWLSTVEKLTEFFSTDQIEASARRTKFVQRASKITGKLFVALITLGRWSTAKTTVAQLAAKAGQLDDPVDITPEALQQRMTARAVAFLQELVQTAFTKLHTGDTICEDGIFAPFPRVHIADSTGFGLPESLAKEFPGAGGSGSKAGAKIQLVWDYKSHTFDHFALLPWNVPDNKYVDTVVELARAGALFLFDLGYFKLAAFATIAAARAYFLSRLNHQTTVREIRDGRQQALDLAQWLAHETPSVIEKAVALGAYERVPARLIAMRMPEAIANERRRQAYAVAKQRGYTPSQAYLTLLAWNLFITNVPATVWSAPTVGLAYSLRWQVGVSSQGSLTQSVQVRPRPTDSSLVAREAPGRESKPVKPS
ncbi:MAG: IS4 family transposase, partial [Deltaproteobacteria bacterium]|nr:IS4 family transposase [Deltaproteobacteria bacterium]